MGTFCLLANGMRKRETSTAGSVPDPDLGREQLMTRPLECNEIGGKLYTVFDSFYIETVVGSASVMGSGFTWTLDDFQNVLDAQNENYNIFPPFYSWDIVLQGMVLVNLDKYVDWETGSCNFDTDSSRSILEFCSNLP